MPGPGCNPKMLDIYFQFPSCRIQHVKVTFVNGLEVFSFARKRLRGLDPLPLQSTTWQLPKVVSRRLHSPSRPGPQYDFAVVGRELIGGWFVMREILRLRHLR